MVIESQPSLRNLQKESTAFLPSSLRQKAAGSLSRPLAPPHPHPLTTTAATTTTTIPKTKNGSDSRTEAEDPYAQFQREMSQLL